jgi:hypothetical protein
VANNLKLDEKKIRCFENVAKNFSSLASKCNRSISNAFVNKNANVQAKRKEQQFA